MTDDAKALLEALNESGPTEELLRLKGIPIWVPTSTKKKPKGGFTAYTKKWHLTGKAKKDKRKMSQKSRRKNRKKRRK